MYMYVHVDTQPWYVERRERARHTYVHVKYLGGITCVRHLRFRRLPHPLRHHAGGGWSASLLPRALFRPVRQLGAYLNLENQPAA